MKKSRNSLCDCGSGKKYKNCCIDKISLSNQTMLPGQTVSFDEYLKIFNSYNFSEKKEFSDEYLFEIFNPKTNNYVGYTSDMPKYYNNNKLPLHNSHDIGSKTFMLMQLERLIMYIDYKEVREIKDICEQVNIIFTEGELGYLKYYRMASPLNLYNLIQIYNINPNLMASKGEIDVVLFICRSIFMEFEIQERNKAIDYGAIRVYAELAHKIISTYTLRRKFLNKIVGYIEGDNVKSWEAEYTNIRKDINKNPFTVEWIPLNKSEHEYNILKINLPALDDNSIKRLASNRNILNLIGEGEIDDNYFSYNSLASNYFGVIEYELNAIISMQYGKSSNMMWKSLVDFTEKNEINMLSVEVDVPNILESLRKMRNEVAHGKSISKAQYNEIEKLIMGRDLLSLLL